MCYVVLTGANWAAVARHRATATYCIVECSLNDAEADFLAGRGANWMMGTGGHGKKLSLPAGSARLKAYGREMKEHKFDDAVELQELCSWPSMGPLLLIG